MVAQLVSGGTSYRSSFMVVDYDTAELRKHLEGRIYGTTSHGCRAMGYEWDDVVGVKY